MILKIIMDYIKFRDGLFNRWAYITIFFSGLLLVLAITLYPYNFHFKEIDSCLKHKFYLLGWGESHILDVQKNFFLFLPLAFGLAGYLIRRTKLTGTASFAIIIVISSSMSFSIEVLQTFLPSRFPSLVDVLLNSAGGILGFLCFLAWEYKVAGCTSVVIKKNIHLSFVGYAMFTILISVSLQHFSSLSNWDKTFPLILGNEHTGDRPWQGLISELFIADRALTETEVANVFSNNDSLTAIEETLLVYYQFAGSEGHYKRKGNLPDLIWRGEPLNVQQDKGIYLDANHWLETEASATNLTQSLMNSNQFTLSVTLTTNDTMQTGPARIVSLSENSSLRNFTLGQSGSNLVFRLRTLMTGKNGTNPFLIVPDIFVANSVHNLVITFDGSDVILYVDGFLNPHTLELNPGVNLFCSLFSINTSSIFGYKFMYYVYYFVVFVPLGVLMTLTVKMMRNRFCIKILIICGGILLPSIILEGILVSVSGRDLKLENLLISVMFMIGPIVFLKYITTRFITTDQNSAEGLQQKNELKS